MDYIPKCEEKRQYEYSKSKLIELHERYNKFEEYVRERREELRGKIQRHEGIVKEWEEENASE